MQIDTPLDIDSKKIVYDGCMITFTGEIINLLKPEENTYLPEDIAHGLAFTCRWNGATKTYFSVAEHCCRMYDYFFMKGLYALAKTALFHDCEEAYWGDIIKPLKNLLPDYLKEAMVSTRNVIFERYSVLPICEEIDAMDFELLQWDFENVVKNKKHDGWDCYQAEFEWLNRLNSILSLERSVATDAQ